MLTYQWIHIFIVNNITQERQTMSWAVHFFACTQVWHGKDLSACRAAVAQGQHLVIGGCWFDSPGLHVEVSLGKIVKPKLLLMSSSLLCMAVTTISVWMNYCKLFWKVCVHAGWESYPALHIAHCSASILWKPISATYKKKLWDTKS